MYVFPNVIIEHVSLGFYLVGAPGLLTNTLLILEALAAAATTPARSSANEIGTPVRTSLRQPVPMGRASVEPPAAATTPSPSSATATVSPSGSSASPGARNRLKRKQAPLAVWESSSQDPSTREFQAGLRCELVEAAHSSALQSKDLPKVINSVQVYEDMRKFFFKEYFDRKKELAKAADQETIREMRNRARLLFARLDVKARITLARKAAASTNCEFTKAQKLDLENKATLLGAIEEAKNGEGSYRFLRNTGAVLTWQSRLKLSFEAPEGVRSVNETVEWLRQHPPLVALWARFQKFVDKVCQEKLRASQWSMAAELCTWTLLETQTVQVHLHLGITKSGGEFYFRSAEHAGVVFEGMIPHSSSKTIPGVSLQGRVYSKGRKKEAKQRQNHAASLFAVHYYLQCESKVGSIFRDGTQQPFRQYPVRPSWITAWVQARSLFN